MSEERKKLYKSVEDEHRRIIASRMEKLVTEKLHTSPADKSNSQENIDNRISSFLNHDKTLEVRQHTVWIKKSKRMKC